MLAFSIRRLRPRVVAWGLLILGCACCAHDPEAASSDYDSQTGQVPITRHSQLDSVIDDLEPMQFKELDPLYISYAGIEGKWAKDLAKQSWYRVRGDQRHRFVVGRFRIQHFLPRDKYFDEIVTSTGPEHDQYWCMDRRVLHKLLDLMLAMHDRGLDATQLSINYGFRHPTYNTQIGGATRSRHQWGQAIDLLVGDVNHDGDMDQEDKRPLIAMLEDEIIGNKGGVGRYPHSQVIHLDVRGYKARWDFQK